MPRINRVALFSAVLLASCETAEMPGETPEIFFTARGNEPGWIVRVHTKNIAFDGDYGATKIEVAKPEGLLSFNGLRYVTERLTVDVTHATCTDAMSGQRYAETVAVLANGKEYKGCGGRNLPPESLNDTAWTIIMMDQLPALLGIPTSLRFADGRVSGSGGCNSFGGAYVIKGSVIIFGELVATEMACAEKQMAQESKLFSLLRGEVNTRYTVEGDMILANKNGQRATLKQAN